MIPLGYMIRHPVKAYKLYKYDKVTRNISKSFANGNIRPTVNEEMFIREQLQNIRRGIGRELSPTELKQFDNLFRKSWKEAKVMEAGYKVLPEDIKVEILTEVKGFVDMVKQGKTPDEIKQHYENAAKVAATAVVDTQNPASKERVKTPVAQYRPTIKGLKQSLLDQLNKRKWSETRNELIYKIEQMDESKLSQLYYENKEYFAIYYYGDSDIYIEDWDQDNFIYGYDDIVKLYEQRYGAIL